MEVVGVVFIATNHLLAVAPFLPTADGPRPWSERSARAHQRLKSQRSAVGYRTFNVSSDVKKSSRKWSGHAPQTVREDAKNEFYRTRHLRVFSSFSTTGRSAPEAGWSALGFGRCSLLYRMVHSVNLSFCSVPV
jgi:hypothetical protein